MYVMSTTSERLTEDHLEDFELSQIGMRCAELREERDFLRESQSEKLESIKSLQQYVKSLLVSRTEDKRKIHKLDAELWNFFQEIEHLKLQLSDRNKEVHVLEDTVRDLELKLAESYVLEATVILLRDEVDMFKSECKLLREELLYKEEELKISNSSTQKLEELIASHTLDSQCEIESLKLDMITIEQFCDETKRLLKNSDEENSKLIEVVKKLEAELQFSEDRREEMENKIEDLKRRLDSAGDSNSLFNKIKKCLEESLSIIGDDSTSVNKSTGKEDTEDLFSKFKSLLNSAWKMKKQLDSQAQQIREYEAVVQKLRDDLKEEKLKAKDEAEDLVQEMAELRYQTTLMVEQECKLRASIENASLQRIAQLESQIQKQNTMFLT